MFKRRQPSSDKRTLDDRVRKVSEKASRFEAEPPRSSAQERDDRRAVFKNGVLIFDNGHTFSVAIKNLSAVGARVEFVADIKLPPRLTLLIPALGVKRQARIAWQRAGAAGLKFNDPLS